MCRIAGRYPLSSTPVSRSGTFTGDNGRVHPVQSPCHNQFVEAMCRLPDMRIETSGDCAWRTDLDADVGDLLGGATRSGACGRRVRAHLSSELFLVVLNCQPIYDK